MQDLSSKQRDLKDRVLLIVDNMRLPVSDGSSERYLVWLRILKGLGLKTYLLNFRTSREPFDENTHILIKKYTEDVFEINLSYGFFLRSVIKIIDTALKIIGLSTNIRPFSAFLLNRLCQQSIRNLVFDKSVSLLIVNKVSSAIHFGLRNLDTYGGLKIIDIHDVHSNHYLLKNMVLSTLHWKDFLGKRYSKFLYDKIISTVTKQNYKREMKEELSILSKFDMVLATSIEDQQFLDEISGIAGKVAYLPPCVSPAKNHNEGHNRREYDLGFIGSSSLFNIDAMDYFLNSIYPLILDKKPDVSLLMGGSICNAFRQTDHKSKISYLDHIEDMNDFYKQISIAVVPLRFGTGVSIKTIEAMNHGCPVVSTPAGTRGLDLEHERGLHIANEPELFADQVTSLLRNDDTLKIMKENALRTICLKYSESRHRDALESILNTALNNITQPVNG